MSVKKRSETKETIDVATWLKRRHILFCHVPNEGARGRTEASILSMMGTRRGVPDLLIFEPQTYRSVTWPGAAIEMKRAGGDGPTASQQHWLDSLADRGWLTAVCYGAEEALAQLRDWGYDKDFG